MRGEADLGEASGGQGDQEGQFLRERDGQPWQGWELGNARFDKIDAGEYDPILVASLAKFHRDHPGFRDGEQRTDDFWNQVEIDGAAIDGAPDEAEVRE